MGLSHYFYDDYIVINDKENLILIITMFIQESLCFINIDLNHSINRVSVFIIQMCNTSKNV